MPLGGDHDGPCYGRRMDIDRDHVWLKVFVAALKGSAVASMKVEIDVNENEDPVDEICKRLVYRSALIADRSLKWIDENGLPEPASDRVP